MLLRLLPLAALLLAAQGLCDCQQTDRLLFPDELINFDHNAAGEWAISVASVTEGGHTKQSITTRVGDDVQRTVRSREGSNGWTYEDAPTKSLTHDTDSARKKVHRGCKRAVQTTEATPSLQSHKGFSVGQWVDVMEYFLEGGVWHHNGRHQLARITRIHPDGSFALERRSGEPVIAAFKSGIRHWHLKARPEPDALARCSSATKHHQTQHAAAPTPARKAPAAPAARPSAPHSGKGGTHSGKAAMVADHAEASIFEVVDYQAVDIGVEGGSLEILMATYGGREPHRDVSDAVRGLIKNGRIAVPGGSAGGIHTQLGDPEPGVRKTLRVWYRAQPPKPLCPETCHGEGHLRRWPQKNVLRARHCYDGNPRFDGVALTDGVCEHHCSKTFQDAPGAPVRRFCGTGPIYSEGESVDCRGCAQLRVQEEEAAQAKVKAEAEAAKARARKAQQEEENARAEAAKAALEAARAQEQRLKAAEQANAEARAQAQKEAEQATRALEEARRTANDLKEQQKALRALEEEAAAARASANQATAALRTLDKQ